MQSSDLQLARIEGSEISGLVAPKDLQPAELSSLVTRMVGEHAHSQEIGQSIIIDLANQLGVNAYGTKIANTLTAPSDWHADRNPQVLYLYPYSRPLGTSAMAPYYTDERGEAYIALVRNYQDRHAKEQGGQEAWQLPGGCMNIRDPHSSKPGHHDDENSMQAAIRETHEEVGLNIPPECVSRMDIFETFDGACQKFTGAYLANMGEFDTTNRAQRPPKLDIESGDEEHQDVIEACWVKLSDLNKNESGQFVVPASYSDQKQAMPVKDWAQPMIERAMSDIAKTVGVQLESAEALQVTPKIGAAR